MQTNFPSLNFYLAERCGFFGEFLYGAQVIGVGAANGFELARVGVVGLVVFADAPPQRVIVETGDAAAVTDFKQLVFVVPGQPLQAVCGVGVFFDQPALGVVAVMARLGAVAILDLVGQQAAAG